MVLFMELSIASVNHTFDSERTAGLSRETSASEAETAPAIDASPEPRYDTYIPSAEQSDAVEPEENVSQKAAAPAAPAADGDTLTTNTDDVDREIEQLEKQRDTLKEEIGQAADDPQRQAELNQQLSKLEAELNLKNTDTYRRQHADYSGDLT
jgi:chromosome segregation ATPase